MSRLDLSADLLICKHCKCECDIFGHCDCEEALNDTENSNKGRS